MNHRAARCALLLVLLSGCAPAFRSSGTEPIVMERLYFGRKIGDSLGVSDSLWTVFLREVVSPRFPDGLTHWQAQGEWRGPDGRSVHEPSYILELLHPVRSATSDTAVVAIIAEYRRRFAQQSVLRVVTPGRASF